VTNMTHTVQAGVELLVRATSLLLTVIISGLSRHVVDIVLSS